MFGCKHQWEEVSRTYTPPRTNATVKNTDAETIRMIAFGVTNITQRCTLCGRSDVNTVIGKV